MTQGNRHQFDACDGQPSQPLVREWDAATRDAGKVRVGGVIKHVPVKDFDAATHDEGKVQFGGVIRRRRV